MIVARLMLPIAVTPLVALIAGLEKAYGKGLTMREEPEGWLCIEKPAEQPTGAVDRAGG